MMESGRLSVIVCGIKMRQRLCVDNLSFLETQMVSFRIIL